MSSSTTDLGVSLRKFPIPALRVIVPAAAASIYCWLVFVTTFSHPGRFGINYNTVGTDWMVFHGAIRSFYEGHLDAVFDPIGFTAYLNKSYAHFLTVRLPFRPWVYPPSFLLILAPFGLLGFLASYALFQLTSLGALVAAIRLGAGADKYAARIVAASAAVSPASAINAVCGQNAFLLGAILIAGVGLLQKRPIVAGLVLGLAGIKPQFAILIPFALIGAREWRALVSAAVSASTLAAASGWMLGWKTWTIWLHQVAGGLASPNPVWTVYGRMWGDSVWTCAILMGAPPGLAFALELASIAFAIGAVAIAFRVSRSASRRICVLLVATLLAAPHWAGYDALFLAIAGLFWIKETQGDASISWNWILVLVLWSMPIFSPPALIPISRPLVPILLLGFTWVALRGAMLDEAANVARKVAPSRNADEAWTVSRETRAEHR